MIPYLDFELSVNLDFYNFDFYVKFNALSLKM